METKIITSVKEAASMLEAGKVVAFPTDTVYGLGVRYDDPAALERLKASKQRDPLKAIPVMCKNLAQMKQIAKVDKRVEKLYAAFMPGALTVILPKQENLVSHIAEGKTTVAIRVPDDQIVLSLLTEPLLVTSANLSGHPSLSVGDEVLAELNGRIDGIVMGKAKQGEASTIVDLSTDKVQLVRQGPITMTEIMEVLENE